VECIDIREISEKPEDMKIHVFDDFIEQHHCNRMLWSFFNALPPFDVTMEEGQDYFKAKKRIYADYIKYCPDSPAHLMFKWVRKKIKRKVHELYGPDHFHHLTLISETAPGPQSVFYHSDRDMRDECGGMAQFGSSNNGYGVMPNSTEDSGERWVPHKGEWIPNHTPTRSFTCILYLNEDFEGGETHFPHFGVQCKPKAGTLLIFDSSWKHEHGVRPVKNNSRFNISSWYASEELNERFKDTEHFDQREQT
tara:strand:- start:8647 stop:9399 length:753 start_codon:yes stop_codon:yes gene_type:complete